MAVNGTYKPEWKNPSFVLEEPNKVTYADRPVPQIEDPHDVIVAVKFTGICGSDVHYWTSGRIGPFVVEAPMVLGHESSGTVYAVGSTVQHLRPGAAVAMEPGIPCRRCDACRGGTYNLCAGMTFAATPPVDGTLARYYRVPADFVYALPPHVPLAHGALLEPLAVAVHVVRQADVRPGARAVVFGCGPVGLLCAAVVRAFSAAAVVAVDINEARARFAADYAGCTAFVPGRSEAAEEIAARLRADCGLPDGADVAIDASGAEVCMQTAVHVLRLGGTYVQGGMGKPDIVFPIMTMVSRELTVKGSFRYGPGDWSLALHLLSSGKVSVRELISKTVKFSDAEEAFGDTKAAKGIKILIEGPEESQ